MHIEIKQGVWWVQSLRKYGSLYFIKHKNNTHAPTPLQKLYVARLLNYQNLEQIFDKLLKRG